MFVTSAQCIGDRERSTNGHLQWATKHRGKHGIEKTVMVYIHCESNFNANEWASSFRLVSVHSSLYIHAKTCRKLTTLFFIICIHCKHKIHQFPHDMTILHRCQYPIVQKRQLSCHKINAFLPPLGRIKM